MKLRWSTLLVASAVEGKRVHEETVPSPASLESDRRLQNNRECGDRNQLCESWASTGACGYYPFYMTNNCAKACNLCGTTATPLPTKQPTVRLDQNLYKAPTKVATKPPTLSPTRVIAGVDAGVQAEPLQGEDTEGNPTRVIVDGEVVAGDQAEVVEGADIGATTFTVPVPAPPTTIKDPMEGDDMGGTGTAFTAPVPAPPPTVGPITGAFNVTALPEAETEDKKEAWTPLLWWEEPRPQPKPQPKPNEPGDGRFRLGMYCETKYYWQNKAKCPDYCLTYKKCTPGSSIKIRRCGDSKNERWKKEGSVLRPDCDGGDKLCVSGQTLKTCNTKLSFDSGGGNKFEIRKGDKLLTNHHHPKDGEPVDFWDMRKCRQSNTNFWFKA